MCYYPYRLIEPESSSTDDLSTEPTALNWTEPQNVTIDNSRQNNQMIVPMVQESNEQSSEDQFNGGKLKYRL